MGRQVMFVLYNLLATTDLSPPENPMIMPSPKLPPPVPSEQLFSTALGYSQHGLSLPNEYNSQRETL